MLSKPWIVAASLALFAACATDDVAGDTEDELLVDSAADGPFDGQFTLARNAQKSFRLSAAPAGHYTIELTGTGDADLYVRVGSAPTTTRFDCRPFVEGSNETCQITLASTASIHIMVRGFAATSTFRVAVRSNPPTTRLLFSKQYRSLLDDDVFLVEISGQLAPNVDVDSLQLIDPTGATILDRNADIGIWNLGPIDAKRFTLFAVSKVPYPTGTYDLSLERSDGSAIHQQIAIATTVSQGRPQTIQPASRGTVNTRTPQFQFERFASPQLTGNEKRRLWVAVERNRDTRRIWEWWPTDPDLTAAAIGQPGATGVTQLTPEEHIFAVGHIESNVVGDLEVGLENRVTTHFFVQ